MRRHAPCVAEIFGRSIGDGGADVGAGIHRFRDPDLTEDFTTVRQEIDTTAFHTYAVDWTPREVRISVDGHELRRLDQSPAYPMQIMIGVFEFPGRRTDADGLFEPEVVVSHVRGWPLETSA